PPLRPTCSRLPRCSRNSACLAARSIPGGRSARLQSASSCRTGAFAFTATTSTRGSRRAPRLRGWSDMAYSHDVSIWGLARKKNRKRGHGVRWTVAGKECSKWFTERALADNYRSKLMQAARKGEGFDTETGLPESMVRAQLSITWYTLACWFVDLKWPLAAAKSRTGIADALATVTPVLVTTKRGKPDAKVLRAALYGWAFHKVRRETTKLTGQEAAALKWL